MDTMIRLEQVTKSFKNERVLKGIDMEFKSGKIYGIVGKNGSGKTVLFKIIAGYVKPSSGRVFVGGRK